MHDTHPTHTHHTHTLTHSLTHNLHRGVAGVYADASGAILSKKNKELMNTIFHIFFVRRRSPHAPTLIKLWPIRLGDWARLTSARGERRLAVFSRVFSVVEQRRASASVFAK